MKLAATKIQKIRATPWIPREFIDKLHPGFNLIYQDSNFSFEMMNGFNATYKNDNISITVDSKKGGIFSFKNNGMEFKTDDKNVSFYLKLSKYMRSRIKYNNGTATIQTTVPTSYDGQLTCTYSFGKQLSTSSSIRIGPISTGFVYSGYTEAFLSGRFKNFFFGALLSQKSGKWLSSPSMFVAKYTRQLTTLSTAVYLQPKKKFPHWNCYGSYSLTPNCYVCGGYSTRQGPGISVHGTFNIGTKLDVMLGGTRNAIIYRIRTNLFDDCITVISAQQPFEGYPTYSFTLGLRQNIGKK